MARNNGYHLSQKMRSNMDTNRITAAPALAGEVTTFYAYDGAGARSRALVHAAWLLSGRKNAKTPVLMIDWDLEGPGLHHYFPSQHGERGGVLELFEACRERLHALGRAPADEVRELAEKVLESVDWDSYVERVDDTRPLYLMRAGRFDDSYGERVDRLDWDALFCACPALFRSFAAHLTRRFAHVLVDCRSGRSAATSVCTALLPDKMVGLFTPEPRSLDGLGGVVRRALDYRCSHEEEQRPLLVYPLPSPPDGAVGGRLAWRHGHEGQGQPGYQPVLEALLGECYGLDGVGLDSYLDEVQLLQAGIAEAILPAPRGAERDRLGPARSIETLLEWMEPGHFPWRPLAEVRLVQAVAALRERAGDAPLARELARLGQLYLGQQGDELEAARRLEQHVIALEEGLHAMEEGRRVIRN
jgi:hypothetical protein